MVRYTILVRCLQYFDAVGWVTGRAGSLYKLSVGVLMIVI